MRTLDDAIRSTSVIIPVKDDIRVRACVASIDEDVEIVVALNGASPLIRALVDSLDGRIVVREIPDANLGAAYNAGVAAASGDLFLFMDSDCVFQPGTIRALVAAGMRHPVVKGRVEFTSSDCGISRVIRASRSFQIAEHPNAYSPPLLYSASIVEQIGGYHYSDLIHWEEDREFDFRLQLAGIPVHVLTEAVVRHDPQDGWSDIRSGARYGIGEAIGQELGLLPTPRWRWRLANDLGSVADVWRRKGVLVAGYRTAWLSAYHLGWLWHTVRDPYRVRPRYPAGRARFTVDPGVPGHTTRLSEQQIHALRASHRRQGRVIEG